MRPGWGRRLVWLQVAVLVVMSVTASLAALAVGPALFHQHMLEAGHDDPMLSRHAEEAFRTAGGVSLLAGLAVSLVIAVGVAWLMNRSLARALDALVDGAARVARGDYDRPVRMPSSVPELRLVADGFNDMAARIARTEATRRRMITDVGHELRTPLATTRVTLESLQDGVVELSPATLDILLRDNARLTALARDLAEVSRAEEGALELDRAALDVASVVELSVAAFRPACGAAGVALVLGTPAHATVLGDAGRLGQVIDNLLRNALQHVHAGGCIRVESEAELGWAVVSVADDGVGIRTDALEHVFDRFYRDDESRTRDVDGGTGVGLAISAAIVHAHGGEIHAASDGPGRGATFTVRLPLA